MTFWLSQKETYFSCFTPSSIANFLNHNNSFDASMTAINSASVVESATHFFNFDSQATTPLEKVTIYPEVEFRSSKILAKSESVYPTNIGFLHPKVSLKFEVPRKYLITHFTVSQSSFLEFER